MIELFETHGLFGLLPEILLFGTAILTLLANLGYREERPRLVTGIALTGMLGALVYSLVTIRVGESAVFTRALIIDPVSQFFKTLLIASGMIAVLLAWMSREVQKNEKAEMHALIVLGTLGMCIVCSAVHFLVLFLAFEMAGITMYALAAFKRRSSASSEAGVKLFTHGALTSVLFAVGIVMLYGLAESFNILDMRARLATAPVQAGYLWVAFGLIFMAVGTRIAVFPFHFLAPDIVEGSPSPVSAYFSVSMTITAMAFALRLCIHLFSAKGELAWTHLPNFDWPTLMAAIAAVTMTVGNLTALHQTNLKRLLGYSCIAQIGYILMGLAVANHVGLEAVLFSLAGYGVMTLGAFFVIQMVTDHAKSEEIGILRGLVWRNPYEGVILSVFLLGLAGLPPLVGFVSRFYILGVVVHQKLYWLSIVGAVNTVIGLTYYLSMIKEIFRAPGGAADDRSAGMNTGRIAQVTIGLLLLPTLALGVYWDPLMNYIAHSVAGVSW